MSVVRMKTRAVAVVHSHVVHPEDNGVINLSNDVIAIQTKKSIKGAGSASLTVVPRRNYFNLIYPNDIINIYFDPGDGKRGFVRTFFGYVDRIERTVTTDDKGATSTNFRITCTDITKPFDRTDMYFNPNLANRKDFLETRFGQSLLAGHALRTRGIIAHGTPSDMIENLASMLLGFGSQWLLPASYKASSAASVDKNRQMRVNRTQARISEKDVTRFAELGGDVTKLETLDDDINKLSNDLNDAIKNGETFVDPITMELAKKQAIAALLEGSMTFSAWRTVSAEAKGFNHTILDLLDLSFIEAMSIDGYISSTAVWQKQGSLASLMYGYSNEIVNELFFDLRPVMMDEGEGLADSCFGSTYSDEPDELGINVNGFGEFGTTTRAVKYAPAIVMREYPYSTSEGIDLSNLFVSDIGGRFSFVPFGPIFSQNVNPKEPVRAIYDYDTVPQVRENGGLSPNSKLFTKISRPLKHLDVIPITSQDVKEETIGRSDNDVFNLFALSAENPLQNVWKYLLQDLFPIVTPVSVERNGLRLMELSTMYANYSQDNLDGKGSGIDNSAIRQNLTRWAFLLDHWNQHNHEYLSGDITLRGMPEIRVGYRLDYTDRHESYYVEEVGHTWAYPDAMQTTVTVSRGQRNDPMPMYIPPAVSKNFGAPQTLEDIATLNAIPGGGTGVLQVGLTGTDLRDQGFSLTDVADDVKEVNSFAAGGGGNRKHNGRLGKYFHVNPTRATRTSRHNADEDRKFENANLMDKAGDVHDWGTVIHAAQESNGSQQSANRNEFIGNTGSVVQPYFGDDEEQ